MNGDINAEAPRPRPLSGIWTLFSWLRRDERSSSSESISSAGSDRTAVSFAFLEPLNYKGATEPIILPPQSPPTDSYRKRVRDRNFRRQRERDITLHRKYGLFKGENSCRIDAFSLPSARRNISNTGGKTDRGRRAASESFQRRAPYVPGKRRAPLPPAITTSLPRNFSRKRPAPQPPKITEVAKENIYSRSEPMNPKPNCDTRLLPTNNVSMDIKIEKTPKQEKNKSDRSFLKQIFENRKRNSAIETNYVKLLPNISELDKQAAKIIENKKLKLLEGNANSSISDVDSKSSEVSVEKWICTLCFRKYNTAISSCSYCIPKGKPSDESSKNNKNIPNIASNMCTQTDNDLGILPTTKQSENEEKKKLKEMLKEMKDSLPKRPKHNSLASESPTLRIGSSPKDKSIVNSESSKMESADRLKVQSGEEKKADIVTSAGTDISITKSDIFQPTSSVLPLNLPVKKVTSQFSFINTGHNYDLSVSKNTSSGKDAKIKNKEYFSNHHSVVVNQAFNIPVKMINSPTTSQICSKENTFISSETKGSVLKPQIKVKEIKENNSNFDPAFQQKVLNNYMIKNLSNIKAETQNIGNTEISVQYNHAGVSNAVKLDPHLSDKEMSQIKTKETVTNLKPEKIMTEIAKSSLIQKPTSNTETGKQKDNIIKPSLNGSFFNFQSGNASSTKIVFDESSNNVDNLKMVDTSSTNVSNIHMPLRISSLLNPVYRPIQNSCVTKEISKDVKEATKLNVTPLTSATISQKPQTVLLNQKSLMPIKEISETNEKESEENFIESSSRTITNAHYSTNTSVCKVLGVTPSSSKHKINTHLDKVDHHSRRRELVNQLEKSIAKGDEQAAADAAIKLAKLRLSCSVLSFSSQIVGNGHTMSKATEPLEKQKECETNKIDKPGILVNPIQVKVDTKLIAPTNCLPKMYVKGDASQTSISKGQEQENKILKDKTSISRTDVPAGPSTSKCNIEENRLISIQVWVEDKEATRGPVSLRISPQARMGELRQQAETSLGLDSRLQRWIVGRTLCLDDTTSLVSLAGAELRAPFYLCIVESESKKEIASGSRMNEQEQKALTGESTREVYNELMKLEQQAIVPNTEIFECGVCMTECETGRGAVLRECIHTFCRDCLSDVIRHCEEPVVSCPAMGCPCVLQEREIRALLSSEEYERWLARGLATAECGTRNAFHCRTRDCTGWAFCEPGVRKFPCPVCKCNNCVSCQVIHEGETCEQYHEKLRAAVTAEQPNGTDEGTQALLNSLIRRGEALECPQCQTIITKKWGCDWVKCSACKTEICWVTRGRRWGPGGRGDTSAGCRCGVDGKRCHPSCGYCH